MGLSADRATEYREGVEIEHPVAATALIYAGSLVAINASGYAVPAADTAGLVLAGLAMARADNSAGQNGDINVVVRTKAVARLKGSSLAQSQVGRIVYVVDDETVAASRPGTAVSAESLVADAGGSATEFKGVLAHGGVVPGGVTINATVGSVAKALTDDGQGRLSGSGGKGFIDYASGYYDLLFTTAPDDNTAITADYHYGAANVLAGRLVNYVSATDGWVALG